MKQKFRVFFGPFDPNGRECPIDEMRRFHVSSDNPDCPLNSFIGNENAVRKLRLLAFDAIGRPDHKCNELSLAFFGPASTGKTTLARLFAKTIGLPFLEVGPKQFRVPSDLLEAVANILETEELPLVIENNTCVLPPMILFIDEVHALSNVVSSALLKATEYDDRMFATEKGDIINCRNVCWMIATTDEGQLDDAFRSRFSIIKLKYLTQGEIGKIVKMRNPEFSQNICDKIAYYGGRMPRRVLELARHVQLEQNMEDKNLDDIIESVVKNEGIHSNGLNSQQMKVLELLNKHPVSANRLPTIVGERKEELEKYILPELMMELEDRPPLVCVTSRGYDLTKKGREFLQV